MSSFPTPEFRQARFGAPLLLIAAALSACGVEEADVPSDPAIETYASSLGVRIADMTLKQNGLYYQDLAVGSGLEAISGREVTVQYAGWFTNGKQFDKGTTLVTLGRNMVIVGWDLGLVGMRPGGKRKLVIGSELAYGSEGREGNPPIPPNTTLVFDVAVTNVV